ncbi:MAG: hypothetical protein JWL86_523 [Rhizobium sp.]|nr:hypothetical protein [Rhizobium sp.]
MRRRLMLAGLSAAGIALSCSHAFAWSCVASSSDGAQGWSSNYPNMKAAERRALNECQNNTTSYDCEVQSCVPDNGKS